jgi:hypothetical protein
MAFLGGVKDVFIDGTERPVQRSSRYETQQEDYSGKKKRHTRISIFFYAASQAVSVYRH